MATVKGLEATFNTVYSEYDESDVQLMLQSCMRTFLHINK